MEEGYIMWKGFKFGMLLQIAVGPVCLTILQYSMKYGFTRTVPGVIAAALVDAIFILFAIIGVGAILNEFKKLKTGITYFGSAVLFYFGLSNILGAFNISVMPQLNLHIDNNNIFITILILTLSNPLTILFWTGVFSIKLVEENKTKSSLYLFGLGALLSTVLSLSIVASLGSFLKMIMVEDFIVLLNILVGILLIGFSVKTLLNKNTE